jgi:hypothetical protein
MAFVSNFVPNFITSFGTVCLSYALASLGLVISISGPGSASSSDSSGTGMVMLAVQMLPMSKPHYFVVLSFAMMIFLEFLSPIVFLCGSFLVGLIFPNFFVELILKA